MADGKVSMPYAHFLGYEKGEEGLPKIVEKEAETVRLIYRMFLENKTPSAIARHLANPLAMRQDNLASGDSYICYILIKI